MACGLVPMDKALAIGKVNDSDRGSVSYLCSRFITTFYRMGDRLDGGAQA